MRFTCAAAVADLEIVEMLVEAGSDVVGTGDDYELGVLGWATCFRRVREDVADVSPAPGAKLDLWSAIALDRADDVRRLHHAAIQRCSNARMSRNEHRRTPLHHAAAKNRPRWCGSCSIWGRDRARRRRDRRRR